MRAGPTSVWLRSQHQHFKGAGSEPWQRGRVHRLQGACTLLSLSRCVVGPGAARGDYSTESDKMSPTGSRDHRGPCRQEQSRKVSRKKCDFHCICLGGEGLPDSGTGMCRSWCENEGHQPAPSPAMGTHFLSSLFREPAGLLSCEASHR